MVLVELITGENDKGRRLDRILRKALPDHPLPLLHRLLRQKKVLINEKPAKANDRLNTGDKINIPLKKEEKNLTTITRILPSPNIIWQGNGLLAVNKPVGLSVHGKDSLDKMVRSFLDDKLPPSLSFKPGPLHRLDKPSSGIIVFSTSIEGARLFSSALQKQKVIKTYLAIVEGKVVKEETWEDCLVRDKNKKKTFVTKINSKEGKNAVTVIRPLFLTSAQRRQYSLITAEIATGRTHQIRVQSAFHGHPLLGDRKYGSKDSDVFFLHAWKLKYLDICIEASLPQEFLKKVEEIFGKKLLQDFISLS
jgi:23S rRNA pseudouridine955/2504/2580 synthase